MWAHAPCRLPTQVATCPKDLLQLGSVHCEVQEAHDEDPRITNCATRVRHLTQVTPVNHLPSLSRGTLRY